MRILNINDAMPCGKYRGYKIKDLIETWHYLNSPQNYLNWAIKTWTNYKFSDEVVKAIEKNQTDLVDLQREYQRNVIRKKEIRKSLDHYNDVGAITDISFQELYGDFEY